MKVYELLDELKDYKLNTDIVIKVKDQEGETYHLDIEKITYEGGLFDWLILEAEKLV
jgi:hypothetical protein